MERAPITKTRSRWEHFADGGFGIPGMGRWFRRNVHDGQLRACVAEEPLGWHLSISWAGNSTKQAARYPTWDEIADARDELLPDDVEFAMVLPKKGEYVALHDTCFHLHEHPERTS